MSEKRVVVLISGNGSNLQALIDAQQNAQLGGKIVAVLSNKPDAYGLTRAKNAGIKTLVIDHRKYPSRLEFDNSMAEEIKSLEPDLVILAGFMRILTAEFVCKFKSRLLNIHPSLLPKYPGLNTHRNALENEDKFHGVSVHFVTEELDGGPVVAQSKIKLTHPTNISEIVPKIQKLEHQLYPQVANWLLTCRLTLENNIVYFDNKQIEAPLIFPSVTNLD